MIRIQAADFDQFLAAFGVLRRAGVEVTATGGNDMAVPDDTDRGVLREAAAWGVVVHASLGDTEDDTGVEAAPDPAAADAADKPARKPRKTTRRTAKE